MSAEARTLTFVGNADSGDITTIELKADGSLAVTDTTPVPGITKPGTSLPLALSPDRSRLYAAVRVEPFAALTFAVDPATGRLALLGSGALADSLPYIATDHTGRYLFGASYGGSRITVNGIDAAGVAGAPLQVEPTAPKAHAIMPDPTNRFVLVPTLGGDRVEQWRFDATTGRLTPNSPAFTPIPTGSGPRHLAFSPDARFVYLLGELDATVHVLPWDAATGTLGQPLQSISAAPADFTGKRWGSDIRLTPDGRFLYAAERTSSTLAAFRVDAGTGRLTLTGTYPTETQPRGFAIAPSGRYLLAVGQLSNRATSHTIDQATGALIPVDGIAVGQNPNWVEFITLSGQ